MKILHTGDWHLGHTIYDYERDREQAKMLESVVEIAGREQPDLMLICGDIFDTSQPSAQSQRLWADTLVALRKTAPDMDIVAIAGNHDSPSRLEAYHTPLKQLGVVILGRIGRNSPPDDFILEYPGKCFVAAVPYSYTRNTPENLYAGLLEEIDSRNTEGLPVVIAAHTTVIGSLYEGHRCDRPEGGMEIIGGIESMSLGDFGRGYDYLALGHIHRPQTIAGSAGRARYSGSPIPMSFDEKYHHGVTIATVERGSVPELRMEEIQPLIKFEDIPSGAPASWPEVRSLLEEYPADKDVYIRLNVKADELLSPVATSEAAMLCKDKKAKFCVVNLIKGETNTAATTQRGLRVEEFRQLSPIEIAERYAAERGLPFDDELKSLFNDVVDICHKI